MDASDVRVIEDLSLPIKQLLRLGKVSIPENGNQTKLSQYGQEILNHAGAAEGAGRDATYAHGFMMYSFRYVSTTCLSKPG